MTDAVIKGTIRKKHQLTPSIIELTCATDTPLAFQAGQYLELSFAPLQDEEVPFWPMAIASGPEADELQFTIRVSETSRLHPYLTQIDADDAIYFRGPKGAFAYHPKPGRHVGMIASGTGIAPLRSMIHSKAFRETAPPTILLLGVDNEAELMYMDEWDAYEHLTVIPILFQPDANWTGERGWNTDFLAAQADLYSWDNTDFYMCGQPEMMKTATEILQSRGVPEHAIFPAW